MPQLLERAGQTNARVTRKTAVGLMCGVIAFALLALYVQRLLLPAVGLFHDDGVYLVTAKALATGQGYRIISLPTPIVQTKYPILFPALLAIVWKVFPAFPDNLILLKLVPFVAALAWFALTYRFFLGEGLAQGRAITLTMVLSVTPWVLFLSSNLLSETLFFALTMAGLLLIRRLEKSTAFASVLPLAAGALAGAATLTRMAGVALIAAGFFALVRKSGKAAGLFVAAALALCLPWLAWTSVHAPAPGSDAYYTAQNYSGWNVILNYAPEQKLTIVLTNIAATIGAFGSLFEYRLALVALLVTAALTAGFVLDTRTAGFTVTHWFCLASIGLTTLWAWMPVRFLVVLTPVLLLFIFRLMDACAKKTRVRWLPVCSLLLVIPMIANDGQQLFQSLRTGATPAPGAANQPPAKWHEYAEITSWLRANAPPGAVIMGTVDPLFYLYTGHPSIRSFSPDPYFLFYAPTRSEDSLGSPSGLIRSLKKQNVTVFVATPNSEEKALKKITDGAFSLAPDAFHLALQLPDAAYRVYLVDPDRLPLIPDLP